MAVHHEFVDVEKLSKFASSKTQQFVSGALTSVAIIGVQRTMLVTSASCRTATRFACC